MKTELSCDSNSDSNVLPERPEPLIAMTLSLSIYCVGSHNEPDNSSMPAAPIFLICSERSGSNLIASIVGEHSEVYTHPPYHLGRDLIMRLHEVAEGGASSEAMQVLKRNAEARIGKY